MMRVLFSLFLLLVLATGTAAKTKTVEGSCIFYIPANMSRDKAVEEALTRAKIDALNRAFGNTILGANTIISTEDEDRLYSNGFNLVKGEWIETLGTPEIKTNLDGEDIYLTVKIRGKAREKQRAGGQVKASILRNGTSSNYQSREFHNGDKLYVRFSAPVDGYLCIFQHDPANDMVYCLLPYRKDGNGSYKVEHDKEYTFFSKDLAENPRMVDEYRLGCGEESEVNTIYILFSPNRFSKSTTTGSDRQTPGSLPFAAFESWKSRCMAEDPDLQAVTHNITIHPNN